jgi:hypothetical protein
MTIEIIEVQTLTDLNGKTYRIAEIIISNGGGTSYLLPVRESVEGDLQALLNAREAELWKAAVAGGKILTVTQKEGKQGAGIARAFFAASPAAIAFVRLTPAEQAAQIDGMSLTQLKTVVKFLAVAVSMLIKRELINGA